MRHTERQMKRTLTISTFIALPFVLGGCSEFIDAMRLQDEYYENFTQSNKINHIELSSSYFVEAMRGSIRTKYSVTLPKGLYTPIATSSDRTFYQSPSGFRYFKGSRLESGVGGIVMIKASDLSEFYVWFLPREIGYFEIAPQGDWQKDVKSGWFNVTGRPWIDRDLKITP